ncbi:MAG: hypothetical protein ABSG43_12450 [Solirubrobacteraceae bacterium]
MAEAKAKATGAVKQKNRTPALPPARPRTGISVHANAGRRPVVAPAGPFFCLTATRAEPRSEGLFKPPAGGVQTAGDRPPAGNGGSQGAEAGGGFGRRRRRPFTWRSRALSGFAAGVLAFGDQAAAAARSPGRDGNADRRSSARG